MKRPIKADGMPTAFSPHPPPHPSLLPPPPPPTAPDNYYRLPFCKPHAGEEAAHRWGGLGEVLQGNELIDGQTEIKFRTDSPLRVLCRMSLDRSSTHEFAEAVRQHYWYELFLDDLPIWGFVGPPPEQTKDDANVYVYTHRAFDVAYNGERVIHVNLTSESPVPLREGADLEFSYSVTWHEVATPFARRFERYLDYNFFEHQIHWFSLFNSFMMVLFLTGLVAMILLRTLRRDYARYLREDGDDLESLERDVGEESGWKLVHGDVFRPPRHLDALAALVGTGMQLALLVLAVILVTIAGALFVERGTILTVSIVAYALTSFVGGYVSGGFYARHGGGNWIRTMLLTATSFPLACFGIAAVLNTIAVAYRSLAAVPFGSIVVVLLIWLFLSIPLCLFGTVVGRNWNGAPDTPCRVKRIPSPIPHRAWYLRPLAVAALGGVLPFGSIFIEMYFVFTSFWNYKVYYVYGFFLLVFIILLVVTLCVTVVATYFLLNAENYHWHWASFGAGASTSIYVWLYSVHYFFVKTKMTGFFQTTFYFGYTLMFCIGLSVMCGSVGYLGASAFVRRIYKNIKCD
ncbi:endomembrane protein 70 [Helicosporidium sp. ATCC 50920]|nr:endomembrane protein 70 [Helicosporidium sp. ATCC 50920]|eukprot:KDD76545.1 endomembrane protein 70 [Helicosporidium sp. ATCC 50920]